MTSSSATNTNSPTAAVLTPRGRGAVATIGFCGPAKLLEDSSSPLFQSASGQSLADAEVGRIIYGNWSDDATQEEVVLTKASDTRWEINCHGGEAAVTRILTHLKDVGCEVLSWESWLSQFTSRLEIEYQEQLASARTPCTAKLLLNQTQGQMRSFVEDLLESEFESDRILQRLEAVLEWSRFGQHLTEPWTIVLMGRPNVGKSSLTNALLGYSRSIVSNQPGTTRDVVTGETAFDGWPFRFVDTAGMREQAEELEAEGIQRAIAQVNRADCRLMLFDTSQPIHEDDLHLLNEWPNVMRVVHKSDLPNIWGDRTPSDSIPVSSLTGEGIETLSQQILQHLIPERPDPAMPIPVTSRQRKYLHRARDAAAIPHEELLRKSLQELID